MNKIKKKFNNKIISLDKFINYALYDKNLGYYMKKNPFGKTGDFITAPMISSLFAEMIVIWCVSFWKHLNRPKKIILCELGPGNGLLLQKVLTTAKKFESFYECLEINLLEKSEFLKKIQKKKTFNNKIKWIKKINQISSGPIIFFGNEFFDSLPIKQIYIKKNKFFEKFVLINKNKKISFVFKKVNKKLFRKINQYKISNYKNVIEYPIEAIKYLENIIKKIKKYGGGVLIIDYGYIKKNKESTLRAIKEHSFSNILKNIGQSDISSHVDFSLLVDIFKKNDLKTSKVVNQNEFLQKLGILNRANILSKNMTFKNKVDMYYRLQKLLSYREMGKIFKVLFAQKKGKKFTLGF